MPRARKKPVEIEYWTVKELKKAAAEDWKSLPAPIAEAYAHGNFLFLANSVEIKTLEGWMTGQIDDVVIQGVKGELYPCKPDIFQATYDAA